MGKTTSKEGECGFEPRLCSNKVYNTFTMENHIKTVRHASVSQLNKVKKKFESSGKWIVLPADDATRLCKGFIAFTEDDSLPEESHYAPMYDGNDAPCSVIEHDTFYSYILSKNNFSNLEGTVTIPCDCPRKLMHGFVVYPHREWHCIELKKITHLDRQSSDFQQILLERENRTK